MFLGVAAFRMLHGNDDGEDELDPFDALGLSEDEDGGTAGGSDDGLYGQDEDPGPEGVEHGLDEGDYDDDYDEDDYEDNPDEW